MKEDDAIPNVSKCEYTRWKELLAMKIGTMTEELFEEFHMLNKKIIEGISVNCKEDE